MARPSTWQAPPPDVRMVQRPVGLQGDAFDAMFGGMGAAGTHASTPQTPTGFPPNQIQRDVAGATAPLGRGSEMMTSSNERSMEAGSYLHPDTLRPMPPQHSPTQTPQDVGWAVGFVVADGGVIRKVVPDTPADKAILQRESHAGIWQVADTTNLHAHHDSVLDLQLPYPYPGDCSITRVQGRCAVGDQIVDVDGESIRTLDKRAIAQLLRRVTMQKDALLITIVRVDKVALDALPDPVLTLLHRILLCTS